MKKYIMVLLMLFLFSCSKEEVVLIPPEYETVNIGYSNMEVLSSGTGSSSTSNIEEKLFSFDVQKGQFIIDKDLDNYSKNYTYKLSSKEGSQISYIGLKLNKINSLVLNKDGQDLERLLLDNSIKMDNIDLKRCLIDYDGSEESKGVIFIKNCEGKDYIIQIINEKYINKDGNPDVGYKAYEFTNDVEKLFLSEYKKQYDTKDKFDLNVEYNTRKASISYEPGVITGTGTEKSYGNLVIKEGKTTVHQFLVKRDFINNEDYIASLDTVIYEQGSIDFNFPLVKNLKMNISEIDFSKYPDKFVENYVKLNDIGININRFFLDKEILDDKNSQYLYFFYPRFDNTLNVKLFTNGRGSRISDEYDKFISNFGFKPGFKGPTDKGNFLLYTYTGDFKTHILLVGKNIKGNKEYNGNGAYIEIDNDFIKTNLSTLTNIIGNIK